MQRLRKRGIDYDSINVYRDTTKSPTAMQTGREHWKGSIKFAESIYMNTRFAVTDLPPRRDHESIAVDPLSL